jgi:hypothetical protein
MRKILYVFSLVLYLGLSPVVSAQSQIDPQAQEILDSISVHMSNLDSLLIMADISEESVYGEAHKLQFGGTLELGIQRPSRFFSKYHADFENKRMYLNDGKFTIFDEDVNVYAQAPAPGSLHEIFTLLHAKFGINSPGGDLFSGNAYELLVGNASKVTYVGTSNVSGNACHHIAGILESMDWQLWVRTEGEPQLCKYVVTDRAVPLAPQFTIQFREWTANAEIPDHEFEFNAPDDAESIVFVQ